MKPALDVGLYSNHIDAMRAFYEGELGLAYNHLLKVGGGVHQHRLDLAGDGVLKLNAARDELGKLRAEVKNEDFFLHGQR